MNSDCGMGDANEAARLQSLRSLDILDTAPEEEFDVLVQAASTACGTPISFMSLVDADRLWAKASHGMPGVVVAPRRSNFCSMTITGDDVLEVPDATLDPRFAGLDSVRAEGGVRFYAGAPIRLKDGHTVGTVCVIDTMPRRLEPAQREVLRCLALAAARGLDARRSLLAQHRIALSLQTTMTALDASHDRLRRHYEATPAMLHAIDADGRLLMVSDLWLSKLGYGRREVIGRLVTDFLTDASRRKARDVVIPRFFRDGHCSGVSYQMVAKNGRVIDVLLSAVVERGAAGEDRHSLTVIEDVTDRLRTARALQDSETRYRRLAEATNDVITQLDMNLVRRYVSPACRSVLGYEPDELIGQVANKSIHPDDKASLRSVFDKLVGGTMPGDRTMVTYRTRHKRGDWIWVEVGLNLVRDPDNTPRHMICALRDITERRRIAEALDAARAAAERAAASKTEFLANMSHELRTPLTGLLGLHDLLAREPDLAPQHRAKLAMAQETGRSLMAVINDVLDFSKIEAGQLAIETVPFDLTALITACRDFATGDAARKGLVLDATVPTGLFLMGDPTRLRQVLLNLLGNAVKFTATGRIDIVATYEAGPAQLRLTVSDTGIGIPDDKLEAIFERFSQADGSITRQFGGSGLGLSICKNLVKLMGGTLRVTSTMGQGSTFTMTIPAATAEPVVARPLDALLAAAVPRRVLLAEDNRLNGMIITEMLSRAGHRVMVVENGQDAMALLAADEPFDVVLMDVQMPVLDGYSATRAIRAGENGTAHRMPILGLTANATTEDEAHCAAAGMDAHVAKPIDWDDLLRKIDRLSGGAPAASPAPPAAAPVPDGVLDRESLATLAGIIGADRLGTMLDAFVAEVRDQLDILPTMPEAELIGFAHNWTSMAGHFGFTELQHHAAELHVEARAGRGTARVGALRMAAERAIAAAVERPFTQSA
ncbi:PAS domain S-box protein [Lichenihabitans sp. Uapishka_5]|uniref:PAS domain S-box protein n=1 Tax=Lichenihabitans sp. Uapishka_5 TaxID=3037302 RepID=UPI0029E7DC44|nr:PAS domain S-box protein [Lichenihabitans sp. Uapishka_5]MDX7953139.1 PAS domain S-box protein [Lichenihabitans sp. Uapishka_5]